MSGPGGRSARGRRPGGPKVGSILTGTVVGQAKRGVMVELGSTEVLLPRARYGAGADRLEGAGYGDAVTVEVVADPSSPGGSGLSRVGIERSLRQPRPIEGTLRRKGLAFELIPADGSAGFDVVLLDRFQAEGLVGRVATWSVGAPHRGVRFVLTDGV